MEVDLPPSGMGHALLPRSQTVNRILPVILVIGGFWLGMGQETGLEEKTRSIMKEKKITVSVLADLSPLHPPSYLCHPALHR